MTTRKLFRVPEGYKITRIEETSENEITIDIEPYKRQKGICSGCGQIHQDTYRGTRIIRARDLPACGKKVYLNVTKRRYLCSKDGKIYIENIAWLKKKKIYQKVFSRGISPDGDNHQSGSRLVFRDER